MTNWSVAADFLALFIPAIIGIVGSYLLYSRKVNQREENLRSAFVAEMKGVEVLEEWPWEHRRIPPYQFLSTSVYERNSGDLALLNEREVSAVVRYYTRAKMVIEAISHHTDVIANKSSHDSDIEKSDREDGIRAQIDKLELSRQRALLALHQDPNNSLPIGGQSLAQWPQLQARRSLLLDYAFLEEDEGEYRFTPLAGKFFNEGYVLTGHLKHEDTLGRDKSYFRLTWESRIRKARSLVSKYFQG